MPSKKSLKERLEDIADSVSFTTGSSPAAAAKAAAAKSERKKKERARKRAMAKPQRAKKKPRRITTKNKPGGPKTPGAKKAKK